MKDKLLGYYRDNVRAYSLVFSYMKREYRFHNVAFYLLLGSFIAVSLSAFIYNQSRLVFYILLVIFVMSFVLFIVAHKVFIRKARDVVRKQLKIKTSLAQWRSPEFDSLQSQMIRKFLQENDMYEKWKIELLIKLFTQDKEQQKVPPLIPPSIFLGLTVPNLTQYLIYLYSRDDVKKFTLQGYIFIGIFVLTLLTIWLMSKLLRGYQELRDDVFLKEVVYRKNLISILENVLLTYKES